jgi:membrane-associated phospholipid phosphatase
MQLSDLHCYPPGEHSVMKKLSLVILFFLSVTAYSQNADIRILSDINLNRNKHLDDAFRGITNSAGPVAFGTPVALFAISLIKDDSALRRNSIYIGASVLSSAIITNILKYSINRPRPYITYPYIEQVTSGGSPSFPSGHTSDAFAFATSVSIAWPKWYIIVPSYAWAGAVAYSRMDLGVHYPSDVLAGAFIGAGSAYLCFLGNKWLNRHHY